MLQQPNTATINACICVCMHAHIRNSVRHSTACSVCNVKVKKEFVAQRRTYKRRRRQRRRHTANSTVYNGGLLRAYECMRMWHVYFCFISPLCSMFVQFIFVFVHRCLYCHRYDCCRCYCCCCNCLR